MKVSEYVEKGIKNIVKEEPEGYEEVGKEKSSCHTVSVYVKRSGDRIEDVKIKATNRCKKLLAISDYVAEKMKEIGKLEFEEQELLEFFKEEKEKEKMIDRINLLKTALGKG